MRVRTRWLLAGLIVAVAAAVALWPRSGAAPPPEPAPDLRAARAEAALAGCVPAPGVAVPGSPGLSGLSGTRVECLADGAVVDLAATLAGRATLVNVWATWCEPCREELVVLAEYTAAPGALPVLGLAVQSPPKDALRLLTTLGVRFANLLDHDGGAGRALRVPDALPASYLIGSDGSVRFVTDPRLFRSVESVRQAVARFLPPEGSGNP